MKKILNMFVVMLCTLIFIACDYSERSSSQESESQSSFSNVTENFSSSKSDNPSKSSQESNKSQNSTSNSIANESSSKSSQGSSSSGNNSSSIASESSNSNSQSGDTDFELGEYDYLTNGILYGDNTFIEKMRNAKERTVLTDTTLYVSTTGNDATKTGAIDAPYKTINAAIIKAASNISKGMDGIVCVRGGNYPEYIATAGKSGNESNYLTLTTYPGEEVRIQGTNQISIIDFRQSNYLIMEGFTICDSSKDNSAAIRMDNFNHHVILKYNTITNVKCSINSNLPLIQLRGSNKSNSHNNILFYKNHLYDCITGWSEAIQVVGNCENINIIENKIRNTGNIGIDVAGNFGTCGDKALDQARNVVVRGNDSSECKSPIATSYAIYVDGAKDVLIECNKAYNSSGGIEIGSENNKPGYEVKNITVRNNLVYDNIENGITVGGYNLKVAGVVMNVKLYNNTVVNNGDVNNAYNGQLTVSMVDGLEVYNNIFYSKDSSHLLIAGYIPGSNALNVAFKSNIYYTEATADKAFFQIHATDFTGFGAWCAKTGETGIYADPLFVNDKEYDFRLSSKSPARNIGNEDIDCGIFDLLINNRKVGIVDLGCYEYFDEEKNG